MLKRWVVTLVLVLISAVIAWAQEEVEPRKLIDLPTAGLLPRGSYDFEVRLYPEGGLLAGVSVGLTDRLLLGVSWGGAKVIGHQDPELNSNPGIQVKYRLYEETASRPAVALGFDSQGYGAWVDSLNRYEVKSKGVYVALAKNYVFWGRLGVHGGINYSLEGDDRDPNLYIGLDKSINPEISVLAEYDLAINDNEEELGLERGYLNVALRWGFAHKLHLELDFKNLLKNTQGWETYSREIRIVYLEFF